jgi:sensor c-di-GMP phosphodiesterase-like protein
MSDAREDVQIGRNGHYVSIDPQSYVDIIDPAKRPVATIHIDTGKIVALSYGADADDMLRAWKLVGNVQSAQWYYAVARSSTRPIGVVVKAPWTSLIGGWPRLLFMWLTVGVVAGAAAGWFAFRRISRQLSFPATLEWAIARRKLGVFYQPIVRLDDSTCVGVEALVRWQLNGRYVSPEIFVAVAEQNHLIQALTDFVLEKVVADLIALLRGHPSFYVSINVSGEDLRSDRFLRGLTAALRGTGIAPAQVRLRGERVVERRAVVPEPDL